ncbi:hypothetical protein [Streptomyces mirabilis]|uniref:hypothetical protein n=1 Tax=Streptomyces mirabilis TaxID=68239 RepID=UPI0036E452A6
MLGGLSMGTGHVRLGPGGQGGADRDGPAVPAEGADNSEGVDGRAFEATAGRLPTVVADLRLVSVEGGPHNICWTHHEEVNQAPLEFLAA